MARISIKLDRRRANKRGEFPIYIVINHAKSNTLVATGIACSPEHFDGSDPMHALSPKAPNARAANMQVCDLYNEVSRFVFELDKSGRLRHMTCSDVRKAFDNRNGDADSGKTQSFSSYMKQVRDTQSPSSKGLFDYSMKWLSAFDGRDLPFEAIDYGFIKAFDGFMQRNGISANTRGIVFRNMRTTLNQAINNGLTENYPFRRFKIPHAQKDKEYLRVEDFRRLLEYKPTSEGRQLAKDLFLLSFYLCGANPIDIFNMQPTANGFVKFVRMKTAYKNGNAVKIRVQPEAEDIIKRYADDGGERMLRFHRHYACYDNFRRFASKKLRTVAKETGIDGLTLYWARYSWATYASRCGVDESVIGRALGHAPSSLAGRVYITFDWERVDEANRRVIDYALHG